MVEEDFLVLLSIVYLVTYLELLVLLNQSIVTYQQSPIPYWPQTERVDPLLSLFIPVLQNRRILWLTLSYGLVEYCCI